MTDPRRGLRWRAAGLAAVAVVIVLWRLAAGDAGGYIVQIEFGMAPELAGASVIIDGVEAGRLEKRRNRTLNGFRVDKGDHTVQVDMEGCLGASERVITGFGAGVARVVAEVEVRTVSPGEDVCQVILGR